LENFERLAVYVVPEGPLYRRGADWLGWDMVAGREVPQPVIPGLPVASSDLTATPGKYGFHGTIKPPFRLAGGRDAAGLEAALNDLAARLAPVRCAPLGVRALRGFVALVPASTCPPLVELAETVVRDLDGWRAAPGAEELARRRKTGLSPRQEAMLADWGYPYVMDEFRFHLTLTGKMPEARAAEVESALAAHFADMLTAPFVVGSLCLAGEAADGRFHLIRRVPLTG
jgi:hypothetical protein